MAPVRSALLTACLLPLVAAFYPYIEQDGPPSLHRREPSAVEGFRVALRRGPVRRENKYTFIDAATPQKSDSIGIDQDGSDYSYFADFLFGTSKEPYFLLLDSAASSTWVMSSSCTTDACNAHNSFGSVDSTSLKVDQSKSYSIVYGTGHVSGILGTDKAHFASFNIDLSFGLSTNVSDEFLNYPMDGILGLGLPNTAAGSIGAPSVMDALISQKAITDKVFAVDLWRGADGGTNDGEISFGSTDTSRYTGDLNYISTVQSAVGFWEIPVSNAGVDGKTAGLTGRTAIIDTGTSFILMPPDDASKLHALIKGSAQSGERFTVPCSTKQLVQLTFGGKTYDISYKDYVGTPTSGDLCNTNIIGRQTFNATQWLVGVVFLKNVYSVFDADDARIGFGLKAPDATTTSISSTMVAAATGKSQSTGVAATTTTTATSSTGSYASAAQSTEASPQKNGADIPWQFQSGLLALAVMFAVAVVVF